MRADLPAQLHGRAAQAGRSPVVIFPGPLNPPDRDCRTVERDRPVRRRWPISPQGCVADRTESLWKHLRHYNRPAPWVAEAWRG